MPDTVRLAVLDTLCKLFQGNRYSGIAVDSVLRVRDDWDERDRAFYTRLVYGVIERKITLDYAVDFLAEDPARIDSRVRNLLRLGIYQITSMQSVPDHAAVSETVELAPAKDKGFVNAILRAYLRRREEITPPQDTPIRRLSVTYSFGEPICAALAARYGEEKTEKMLEAMNRPVGVDLRVNTLRTTTEALRARLADEGVPTEIGRLPTLLCASSLAPARSPAFAEGLYLVQDAASQFCAAVLDARPGQTVVDVCAAPGSKSFGAAFTMENKGKLFAYDLHENKLSLVRRSAERLGITVIETAAHDARLPIDSLIGKADRVICDVPCSGFGVIAKKPELRYKDPAESASLPTVQSAILATASQYLAPSGILVYSTCTVLPEENTAVVEEFLATHPDFEAVPFSVGGLNAPEGQVTLLPDEQDTDGFFIAKLRRKERV